MYKKGKRIQRHCKTAFINRGDNDEEVKIPGERRPYACRHKRIEISMKARSKGHNNMSAGELAKRIATTNPYRQSKEENNK